MGEKSIALAAETEFCAAAMAKVHIKIDLAAALQQVGCIPQEDYGNMLIFVNTGGLAAAVRLRGRVIGSMETIINQLTGKFLDLEVKAWRDQVYTAVCNGAVPDPGQVFIDSIKK